MSDPAISAAQRAWDATAEMTDVWYLPGNVWLKHAHARDLVTEAGERPWL